MRTEALMLATTTSKRPPTSCTGEAVTETTSPTSLAAALATVTARASGSTSSATTW